jgi:hypothetical protein
MTRYSSLTRKPKERSMRTQCEQPWDISWCFAREERRRVSHERTITFLHASHASYDSTADDEEEQLEEEATAVAARTPETGVDVTAQSMRMLQLSKLRAAQHFDALKAECLARGVHVENNFTNT